MAVLAAIINFWDGGELLPAAVANWWRCGVDRVIIIYSDTSNYGEYLDNTKFLKQPAFERCDIIKCEPEGYAAVQKETQKRNRGLQVAITLGVTHFVTADCDEFYDPEHFQREYKRLDGSISGLVCASRVYFKSPTLCAGLDVTLVPFIHRLDGWLMHRFNRDYPFAFAGNSIKIDPSRQLNITSGVIWSDIIMEHFSWVRDDIERKIRNSSARVNIERSDVREEFRIAEAGYFLKFYKRTLYTVEDKYGILEQNLRTSHGAVPSGDTCHKS